MYPIIILIISELFFRKAENETDMIQI
jgi:hypothetical protein